MKAKLTLLFSLLAIVSNSQTWAPIGAKWYYSKYENLFPTHLEGYILIESVKDTVINGIACRVLNKTLYASDGQVESWESEYTYILDSIVYYKSGNDFIELYNFKKEIGDTIDVIGVGYNVCTNDSIGRVVIMNKTDTIIASMPFLKYETDEIENTYWNFNNTIFERIGCLDYMFPLQVFCGVFDVVPFAGPLRCYEDSEIGLIKFSDLNCDSIITLSVNKEEEREVDPVFYPNPFIDALYFSWNQDYVNEAFSIQILNPSGQVVYANSKIVLEQILDLHFLEKGIYFIYWTTDANRTPSVEKLIKL